MPIDSREPTLPERRDAKRSVRVGILDTRLFEHSDLDGRYHSKKVWPAALPQVIAVGADKEGSLEPAAFSPVNTEWVDLMAPGEQVYSTYELKSYAHWDGTSFATPAVSGAIAYLMQTERMSPDDAGTWLKTPPADRKAFPGSAAMDDIRPI